MSCSTCTEFNANMVFGGAVVEVQTEVIEDAVLIKMHSKCRG